MGLDVTFLGDRELSRKLRRLENNVANSIMKPAAMDAAVPILAAAKAAVPVDRGRLKQGLRIAGFANKSGVGASVKTPTRKRLGIDPKAKGFYPMSIEYGYILKLFGGPATRVMPARPYLRPALEKNAQVAVAILSNRLRRGLLRLARRA